jgi:RimJ/RimL family protein N-acetyltransferase
MKLKHKNLEIRLAVTDDAGYFLKHWNESGWHITLDEVHERLEENRAQHIIEINGRIIGDIHYGDLENTTAEIGIYIREENEKGKGYGLLALNMYIDALFTILGYNKIRIATGLDNKAMRHISENKYHLTPTIHEDAYQENSATNESYAEYILEKENWGCDIEYEIM